MCLRNDVPLRGNGGDFLSFAVQQSAVGAGGIEQAHLLSEKYSRKIAKKRNACPGDRQC